ncbi:hypothetical protein ACJX0J_016688, partial [Zea mays]
EILLSEEKKCIARELSEGKGKPGEGGGGGGCQTLKQNKASAGAASFLLLINAQDDVEAQILLEKVGHDNEALATKIIQLPLPTRMWG